ncbi:hypothetical protein FisN_16Lh230 [Fistulifera solaris]|uniref:Uncharacterized protein n=1 Tax=Fistulifera solaris TaxID=1519565 RepID=A0A1Z5J6A9_FISSO|nr:hypothetical protein FisN_16Lh230 [Fistulifera solaris]|eukprot:GAX09537.1 hypothetical protein FisN_16Lh230 [Fistulifera solaris]
MAPNKKHATHLSHTLATLRVIRAKSTDYQTPTSVVDSASYWEWPSTTSIDFSVGRIESNLVVAAKRRFVSSLQPENDDYWAESDQISIRKGESQITPQERINSIDYWAEESYEPTRSDVYWNTASLITHKTIRNPHLVEAKSDNYWQERVHDRSNSDAYWQEALPSQNYWTWNVESKTESDNYWDWAAFVPTF